MTPPRRPAAALLLAFARDLLRAAGLPDERGRDVAEVLLEGDLLGHTTHGLALLPSYLKEIREGRMPRTGAPRVVSDQGAALTWDGNYLPGPWLMREAIRSARQRLADAPFVSVVIGRCHHLACLQAYLKPVTDAGQFILLTCTDPANRWVVPPGGVERCYSPNPLAAGIPTAGEPVLIDISTSTTAYGVVARAQAAGTRLPGPWLVSPEGTPTDDPAVIGRGEHGGLYPLGGADLGYKGFGLALLLEAMTSALAGHGRADGNAQWGCSAFLLLIDPERFGGRAAFLRETGFLADACRRAAVPPGGAPVRLPGQAALARRAEQLAQGVHLHPDILPALQAAAREWGVKVPDPLVG